MPSEKVLSQKKEVVEQLKTKVSGAMAGVLVDYKGITVADDTKLRTELREAGIEYSVVKNTLLRFAVAGTDYEEISGVLEGTTALAISNEDPIAAAKILQKYSDSTKGAFAIKAGFVDGKPLDATGVASLAKLPGKQELLTQLCYALNGNITGLAIALQAIADKDGEETVA